jgi:FKBP-type peptidyl-prolyl cis-trans isomerase
MSQNKKTTASVTPNNNTDSKIGTIVLIIFLLIGLGLVASQFFSKSASTSTPTKQSSVIAEAGQDVTELKIEDTTLGKGREVKSGDLISIHYKGTLLNGKEFDSSYNRNKPLDVQIGVGAVIKGWDEGIVGLKEGGKRKLTIPSNKAYGATSKPTIPANSALVFEVELLKIVDKPATPAVEVKK